MRKRPRTRARGPRADAKRATRAALVEAALAEFAAHGLDVPSLDAICARAGYTRGAFYVHFRNRDDLLVAVVEHAMQGFLDAVLASGDEAHDLERTIGRFADAIAAAVARPAARAGRRAAAELPLPPTVPFARVLDGVTRSPRLRASFTGLLAGAVARLGESAARGQHAGAVRADVDARAVGALLAIVALGTLVALDAGLALDPRALRATVLRLLVPVDTKHRAASR